MSLIAPERIGFLRPAGYHWQNSVSAQSSYSSVGLHRVWVQKVDFAGFLVVEPLGVRGWNHWPNPSGMKLILLSAILKRSSSALPRAQAQNT